MDNQLPHNDPDLKRARSIRKAKQDNKSLEDSDDSILQQLQEYQDIKHGKVLTSDKEKVWHNISSEISDQSSTPVTPLFSSSTMKWAVAAVLILGAFISYVIFQPQQPELVASSQQSIKTVTLGDGSSVTLRPHSKLYGVNKPNTRQYQLEGEGFFEVTHNPNRPFAVETSSGTVNVLGTTFMLSSWGQKMQVYLKEGSVQVKASEQDSAVVLEPGESASVTNTKAIPSVQLANAQEFTDWMNQQMVFSDKSARQVVAELEQQFNISISLPKEVTQNKLSGALSLNNLSKALNDLELVLNGKFVKMGEQSYRFEGNSQ
ncbi:FecR family protein [Fodinibius salinus]|uniref:FecR family protein n=1 Tax=Fodinibius salinus TaxID=860790 RepID=A0A5D3YLM3_9BACT|nr:FecR domain-containing protein [Fodinibius salinus]TYP92798.1 FecR family protein [Fodinibius salinus]